MLSRSAIFIETPEAEFLVSPYRGRSGWDAGYHAGNPAHITITIPFVPPPAITEDVHSALSDIAAFTTAFTYDLTEVSAFPTALWLRPQPEDSFRAVVQTCLERFPDYPPFGGVFETVQPHLTLALNVAKKRRLAEMRAVAEREIGPELPLSGCKATSLALYICDENGQWNLSRRYPFRKSEASKRN